MLSLRTLLRTVLVASTFMPLPGLGADSPARLHRYTVSIDEALSRIAVRACFAGKPPLYLVAESLDAASVLEEARVVGGRKALEPNGAELKLGVLPDDSCLNYFSNLGHFHGRHDRGGSPTRKVGGDLITDLGLWFWRPDTLSEDEDIEVRFDLPAGLVAAAPWRLVEGQEDAAVYRVGHGPYDWPAAVAFGRFQERELEVQGGRLRYAVLEGSPRVDPEVVHQWLARAAGAVTALYGRFPVAQVQVLVIPGARGNEPIPWAYVQRGGGPAVHFFINQRQSLAEFESDWTSVHELAHLLLPYVQSEDAWLSEGLASYYQNVLRARAGIIDVEDAWQRMHSGFRRGMKSMPNVTLAAATERMHRDGAFMRVYWEGAAIWLLADQRLRERTQGAQSLDTALAALQACCLAVEQGWRAHPLMQRLDQLTGTTVFTELHDQHIGSEKFPDLTTAYRLLGLEADASGSITLLRDAPQIAFRNDIMKPASGKNDRGG